MLYFEVKHALNLISAEAPPRDPNTALPQTSQIAPERTGAYSSEHGG